MTFAEEANVILSYDYDGKGKQVALQALVNLEDPTRDCYQGIVQVTIEKLDFEGASTQIIGFRAKDIHKRYWYFNIDSRMYSLSEVSKAWITTLIKEGKKVTVTFQQCGAGGRVYSIRDIYAR